MSDFDYRQRLYDSYVSGLLSFVRDLSLDGIRRDFPIFEKTIGPFLPTDKQAGILDLGCGYGALVFYLQSIGYHDVVGIDRSSQMVSVARKLGIQGIEQAELSSYLHASPSRWALITATDVIEHFRKEEVLALLDTVFAALAPGGVFLMQTPNAMSKYGRWERYNDFTHEMSFDARSARQCLIAAGFTCVRVLPIGPVVHGVASAIRKAFWILWEPWLKLSFAIEAGWESGQVFTPNLIAVGCKAEHAQHKDLVRTRLSSGAVEVGRATGIKRLTIGGSAAALVVRATLRGLSADGHYARTRQNAMHLCQELRARFRTVAAAHRGFSNGLACMARLMAWRFVSRRIAPPLWRSRHGTEIFTPHYTWFATVQCFGYDSYRLRRLPKNYPLHWFLDIGAHIGTFALAVLERWPGARGIACEPSTESFAALTSNLQRNHATKCCECLQVAVVGEGDPRSVSFRYKPLEPSTSSIMPAQGLPQREKVVTVAATSLAGLIRQIPQAVDLVKIDVEG